MLSRLGIMALAGLGGICVAAVPGSAGPCDLFRESLETVPHTSLIMRTGEFASHWDGETYGGCEVEFETLDSIVGETAIPDFFANPESELYRAGWRMSAGIGADGAGSGIHGIERGTELCVIRWEQPAYINDAGEFVESDTFRLWIQCRDRETTSAGSGPGELAFKRHAILLRSTHVHKREALGHQAPPLLGLR